jgi:SNF2 family DNA or RNA helicase
MYRGEEELYYIDDEKEQLVHIPEKYTEQLEPLAELSGESDDGNSFAFQVGRNHLSEFYQKVLPQLEDLAQITETDPKKFRSYLTPEARYTFYLDAPDNDLTCRPYAKYGNREVYIPDVYEKEENGTLEPFRDFDGEHEILSLLSRWFPCQDPETGDLSSDGDEDRMYQVMARGTEQLMELGEVRCTKRFRDFHGVRPVKVSVGVSVSSGLLELDIATDDVSPQELLDLLGSYRLKKKYYRLKDGSFVDLEESNLETLAQMVETLHLKPKEFIKGKMHLPMYRTLYLDKMLEENETIYSSRDSHFREVVKGFKTVKDADFEEPKSLSRIMRNYQKNGYKWLRTLEAWKFGGILADDMGLGKTLQMIAVLLAAKEEGKKGTSLVVAPASLVYNWGEELKRFAPALKVTLITGNQEERRAKIMEDQEADVMVTSYDLLKRDIAFYEDRQFLYEVIDEAQYIKNHTTAAAKAVKVINSQIRYALTGTPIENRLSELWSIFDYLMPGLLYGYDVFKKEIETPIVKNQDKDAMERLQKMAGPFILRRLKEDVLKDLPKKMEESRYVRLGDAQQKLYDGQVLHMKAELAKQDDSDFNKNKMMILAELTRLRQICCDPSLCYENYKGDGAKLEACMQLISSAMDGGHRMLVFSQFTSMLEILERELEKEKIPYFKITGSTSKEKRLQMVKAFNEGDTPVFLISLKAGGVGLNLTGADVVIHYDPWWNLAVQNQATDRAHRIGQTKKVTVYKLIAKGTIEEKIQELQEKKRDLAEQVIGGETGNLGSLSREEIMGLLEVS